MRLNSSIRAREARMAERIGRLLGLDAKRVGIAHATIDEPFGEQPTLRVEVIMRINREEAIRLRYGDDAKITRTERGTLLVNFPDTPEEPDA